MGIRVVVLSVGYTPGTGSCLVQLSLTGSSLRPPEGMETLYWPDTSSSLSAAVDSIVRGVATTSCTLDTNDVPAPAQIQLGVSLGDDNWIAPDPENGWSFANLEHTSIKLSGQACDQFVRSSKSIYAGYFCSTCGGYNACP